MEKDEFGEEVFRCSKCRKEIFDEDSDFCSKCRNEVIKNLEDK